MPNRPIPSWLFAAGRWIVLFLDVVLVALFAIGYASGFFVPGGFWWTELIAVGLPYLAALLLPATLVWLWMRHWPMIVLHIVLLLLAGIRFFPLAPSVYKSEPADEALRVLSFNVSPWWDRYTADERAERMLAFIRETNPHLAFFQEASIEFAEEAPEFRAREYIRVLWEEGAYRTTPLAGRTPSWTPQPVLARVPLHSQRQETIRMHPRDRARTYVVRSRFTWQGRDAVAYNLHLRSFGEDKPWRKPGRSLLNLASWIPFINQYRDAFQLRGREVDIIRQMIEQETLPVLVVGDLNSTAHNWAYRRLARGFQDAFQTAGKGWGATYHTTLPVVRIDFILAGPEFEVLSAEVVDSRLSDHRPVVATLRWRE